MTLNKQKFIIKGIFVKTINDLISDMRFAEIDVDASKLILDGSLHRLPTIGKPKSIRDAWYVIHSTPKGNHVAIYQNYRQTEIIKWYSSSNLTTSESRLINAMLIKADKENQLYKSILLQGIRNSFNNTLYLKFNHDYLIKKKITELLNHDLKHKFRIDSYGNLVIPVLNMQHELMGIQRIKSNGDKRFDTGTSKKGNFYPIMKAGLSISDCARIHIGEGLATMGSLCLTLKNNNYCYLVAFDVGNIDAVYQKIRSVFPLHPIVLIADNDCGADINIGVNTCKQIKTKNKYDNYLEVYIPKEREKDEK
jgi:putative DNA primase/helicase